jgi:euchromatic histone-lysine N-methyltransferase
MERRRIYTLLRQYFEGRKTGKSIQRPDLPAMKVMNKEGLSLKFEDIGTVPGVLVGDTFDYRTEMYVVGLHRQVQAGIAYTHFGGELLATSIVASGGYEDDEDYGDVLHYSGQGGNDYKGEKRQVEDQDQKEKVANEALLNSYKLKKPVRVSRGYGVDNTHGWTKSYSYDGLYTVSSAKLGVGTSGHKVYKFKLKRNPDQPELRFRRVQFQGSQVK